MKPKELKELSNRIVKCEKIIKENNNPEEVAKARQEIEKISYEVDNIEDFFILDCMVWEMLENLKK